MSCRFNGNYYCVKSVRIWSNSGPYSVRMREIRTRITPNTDTVQLVSGVTILPVSFQIW